MIQVLPQTLARKRDALRRMPPQAEWRSIRERAGATQTEVAEMVGGTTTAATVSRWESGKCFPRGESLRLYVEVLAELVLIEANHLLRDLTTSDLTAAGALGLVTEVCATVDRAFEIRGETP